MMKEWKVGHVVHRLGACESPDGGAAPLFGNGFEDSAMTVAEFGIANGM